jgi:hypothetical protein
MNTLAVAAWQRALCRTFWSQDSSVSRALRWVLSAASAVHSKHYTGNEAL